MRWEEKINIQEVREIRCKTTLYLGVGAIQKVDDICEALKTDGVGKIMVVASRTAYKVSGAWSVMEPTFAKHGIEYRVYDEITPNPEDHQVDEATAIAKEFGAQAVFGVGGGSPIDAAKSVAILIAHPEKSCRDLYTYSFTPNRAVPLVAINTTHGTGTEVDRFAVVTIPDMEYKPAIAYDCIYPVYAIDDPALITKLAPDQTLYVTIDALNHVTEAATTTVTSPYAITLAKETIRLIAKYLPQAMKEPEDLRARYWLLYASAIAGISFDNGLLHFTHALEHPLSAVKPELAHGLGLAMLLPAVLQTIYPSTSEVLADIYSPIVPELTGDPSEAKILAASVERWLFGLGVSTKLENVGYTHEDIEKLTHLAKITPSLGMLLGLAPVDNPEVIVRSIYTSSLKPLGSQ